jgi:3-oxoacyl-[acyl-carrier protein] reductase
VSEPRTVLITGGSRGLGAGLVRSFLDAGDRVATCSRSATPETDAWSADPSLAERFLFEALDLGDRVATDAFVGRVTERLGAVDVLVNNAGVARDNVLGLVREDEIDEVIDLNLKATIRLTRAVTRRMLRRGSRHQGRA